MERPVLLTLKYEGDTNSQIVGHALVEKDDTEPLGFRIIKGVLDDPGTLNLLLNEGELTGYTLSLNERP